MAGKASGRMGKASIVDKSARQKEDTPEPEPEPEAAPESKIRSSRATKSALLQDPPWAALKPKSRSKAVPKEVVPIQQKGIRDLGEKAERRKRSGSAVSVIEAHQPRPKKLKTTSSAIPTRRAPSRRSSYRPPRISADSEDDDMDGRFNDSGEDDAVNTSTGSDASGASEEKCDNLPPQILRAEHAKIIKPKTSKYVFGRSSPVSSDCPPPTSDFDDILLATSACSEGDASDIKSGHSRSQPKKKPSCQSLKLEDSGDTSEHEYDLYKSRSKPKKNRQVKLEEERPIIHSNEAQVHSLKKLPNASSTSASEVVKKPRTRTTTGTNLDESAAEVTKPWKPRTALKIFMRTKKTAAIGLKEQNSDVQKVIHDSFEFAKLALVVGDPETMLTMSNDEVLKMASPFGIGGLDRIALASLIKAADSGGYNGEYDIAHRLEEGSQQLYIEPLVVQRLSIIRSSFKKCITLVAPGCLGLQTNTYQHNNDLLRANSFIYPWSVGGGFDTAKPFQNEVIAKAVECAFFTAGSQYNNLGLEFAGRLTSSSDAQVGQREVSLFMVALASVGVASVIQDMILARSSDFAGPQLDSLFKKLVIILLMLRRSKPVTYHKLMHGIYDMVVGEKPVNVSSSDLTAQEILGEVNWDLIDD